jgi:Protein of unknown function (DUF1800)
MANPRSRKSRRKRAAAKRCGKGKTPRTRVHRHKGGKRHRHITCVPKRKRRPLIAPAPPEAAPPAPGGQNAGGAQQPGGHVPPPAPIGPPVPGVPVYAGAFGTRQAERLLWRAGFGPAPGQASALASMGLAHAVRSLTRPSGAEVLTGPEPRAAGDVPLSPMTGPGHDHLWWLDRMVRTNRPFVERMTLVWHDWFATSNAGAVNSTYLMFEQNELLRREGLGSFRDLLVHVTADGAMLKWLNLWLSSKVKPDENYGREAMELFTLGADRGAYTEDDVREMARALAGWGATRSEELGFHDFGPRPKRQDTGQKTIFGRTGNFLWEDACRLCVEHPMHPSFLVTKLWSYFIPTPPDDSTRQALEAAYTANGYGLRQLFEAILMHPDLYEGEELVKPPVVFAAGLLRGLGRRVTGAMLTWCEIAGQRLFYPPNVDGWNHEAWLDTSTMRARWMLVQSLLDDSRIDPGSPAGLSYDPTESGPLAVRRALEFWGDPPFSDESRTILEEWAAACLPPAPTQPDRSRVRVVRQNALRQLVGASPDLQVC